MAEQAKGNWKIWALVAALLVVGGGYFGTKVYMEKKMVADIERTLANLPGGFVLKAENIAVNSLSKSAVLTKVTGSGKVNGKTITLSADSAESKGINLHAFEKRGVTSLGDSLTLRNVKIAGAGVNVSIGLYQLEKVEGDFLAISEQSGKLSAIIKAGKAADRAKGAEGAKKAQADLLAAIQDGALLDAFETLSIGKSRLENYAITMDTGPVKMNMSADLAESNGINLRAFKEQGVTNLIDSLNALNVKLNVQDVKAAAPGIPSMMDASIGRYQLEKVQGDFFAIAEQSGKLFKAGIAADRAKRAKDAEGSKKAEADLLAALQGGALDALETLRIGKARVEKYSVTMNLSSAKQPEAPKFTLRMDSAEGTDYFLTHSGPMSGRGLVVEMNDKPLASLEEMSLKSMDMPLNKELLKQGAGAKPSFKNLTMSMQDLRLKKLGIILPMREQEKISLEDFSFSISLNKGSGTLGLKVGALDLPTTLLVRDNPQGSALLTRGLLPPRILLNANEDIGFTGKENDLFDMLVKSDAAIKDFGAVVFSGDLLDIPTSGHKEPRLRKLGMDFEPSSMEIS